MPWESRETDRCPAGKPYGVFTKGEDKLHGCHESKAAAATQIAALYADEPDAAAADWEDVMEEVVSATDE